MKSMVRNLDNIVGICFDTVLPFTQITNHSKVNLTRLTASSEKGLSDSPKRKKNKYHYTEKYYKEEIRKNNSDISCSHGVKSKMNRERKVTNIS